MNLYICEKPSLAKALFLGLGGTESLIKQQQRNGYFETANHVVTFCFGHMLELLDPEEHDEKYSKWDMDLLPFRFPPKLKIKKDSKQQYTVISSLMKKANVIYNCGDADEEGQALIDEILLYEGWKGATKRIFITDYNLSAVKKSIANQSDNKLHVKEGEYSFARSISDQLFGYNLTRAYSIAAQKKGYTGVLNVGRVQTAIVHLINERCKAVETHKESYYFNLIGFFNFNGVIFPAKYLTNDNDITNDKSQLSDEKHTQSLADKINGKQAVIMEAKHGNAEKLSPMPYTLATLQSDCARKFGVTAQQVLDAAQSLYETHKVLTYPRSNCSFLGSGHFNDRKEILKAIADTSPALKAVTSSANATKPHKCFDDKKVTAHHGIVPTSTAVEWSKLSELEQKIYNLVARSYIALLFPASLYNKSKVRVKIAELQFYVESENCQSQGWEVLYKSDQDNPDLEQSDSIDTKLASIKTGDHGVLDSSTIQKKNAPAPKYYVESTLLRELTHIAKHIESPELKDSMNRYFKEKNIPAELGTEATRAAVIEKVFESGQCEKVTVKGYKEKAMITTKIGKQFIEMLPDGCKRVDVTAEWVKMGVAVKAGEMNVTQYVDRVYDYISKQVNDVKANGIKLKLDLEPCSQCSNGYLVLREFNKNKFFSCSNYPTCETRYPEYKDKPYKFTHKCPDCGKPLTLRKGDKGYWFGCSGYKEGCKTVMDCVAGKPTVKKTTPRNKATARKPNGGTRKALVKN